MADNVKILLALTVEQADDLYDLLHDHFDHYGSGSQRMSLFALMDEIGRALDER